MMRNLVLATIATFSIAHADPPVPDLTLTWDDGEMSSDASEWHTVITVTGTKVHYTSTYDGRDAGQPQTKPVKVDGVVKDPKRLAAALASLDAVKPGPTPKARQTTAHRDSACLHRAVKSDRCISHIDGDPETADYKAFVEIRAAISDGLKLDATP
jgi:hypothetical protein